MAKLSDRDRNNLPDSAFAYVDAKGVRRLPIYDESHVRNALARFEQVKFQDEAARDKARRRLLQAAKKYGIVPVGFITTQLETERVRKSAPDLPSGFLTLMFTDIENSTKLLDRLGDDYARLLQKMRRIIRRVVGEGGGHVVEMRADESFTVFTSADAGVAAAAALQRALVGATWPGEASVAVRAGLHSGEVTLGDTGYVGLAVHAAARVSAAAHGGQILVSGECRTAAGVGSGIGFRSLGKHRFAGFAEALDVFQVEADGLRRDFPAVRRRSKPGAR